MTTLIIGAIVGHPPLPVALNFSVAFSEFNAGHAAYFNRRGPGPGRLRCAGWLQAHREEQQELAARQEERQQQF